MFPCSPPTCRAQPPSSPPARSWIPHPAVLGGGQNALVKLRSHRDLSQGGGIHPTEGTVISQPLNCGASGVWAGSCGEWLRVLKRPGQQEHVHARLCTWVDGCAHGCWAWMLLFLPSCSIISLVYFGMIMIALEAKGELMGFMVSCNHANLEITCGNMVFLLRSRCI